MDYYLTQNPSFSFAAQGGILNLKENSNLTLDGVSHTISDVVKLGMENNAILEIINGGALNLDNSEGDLRGKIILNGGTLTLDNTLEYATLEANSGTLNIDETTLNNGGYIKNDVDLNASSGLINIENGVLNVNNGDDITGATINIVNEYGIFNYGIENNQEFQLGVFDGNVNILENAALTLENGSSVAGKLNLQKNATLSMKNGTLLNMGNTTNWDGAIKNDGGMVIIDGYENTSSTASFVQTLGSIDINNSNITFNQNSGITGGDVYIFGSALNLANANVTGGNLTIDGASTLAVKKGTFSLDALTVSGNGALINVLNGENTTHSVGNLNIATGSQADFNIDIYARSNQNYANDQFRIGTITGDGKLNISNWSLGGDIFGWGAPIDEHIKLANIFADNSGNPILNENISITNKTTFTPIGYYQLNKNIAGSGYTLDLVKYNPQAFRGQVTTVAQWMNQLAINDILFTHSMVLPSFKDGNGKMANNYASTDPLFAPYQYSIKDGGMWYKAYGTFEHLQMNQGLRIGNNSYGSLIGADFGLKELKGGWKFMPSAYIGYNGAHQYGSGMSQYQNGAQAGFLGTWYKNNTILSGLAYGGVYNNKMNVSGNSENTFNYFAGTAGKAAYNFSLYKDLVLQPNLLVAYNFFGQQNWHSDFGQMGMMAGMLHGVNIAPGVNLIWEKETFSSYLTLQYMYNVNGAAGGRAGNVSLPHVEMERGYIQYGLGFTKKFTNRVSGYLQAVFRNVGRTGVGFQAGIDIKL